MVHAAAIASHSSSPDGCYAAPTTDASASAPSTRVRWAAGAHLKAAWYTMLLRAHIRRGNYEAAQVAFERAAAVAPRHAPAHEAYADVLLLQGRVIDAIVHLELAADARPNSELRVHRKIGLAQARAGNLYTAFSHLRLAGCTKELGELVSPLLRARDYPKAMECIRIVGKDSPRGRDLLVVAGEAQVQVGALDQALDCFKSVNDRERVRDLARRFFEARRYDRALECIQLLGVDDPAQQALLRRLGDLLADRGELAPAIAFFGHCGAHLQLNGLGKAFVLQGAYNHALSCFLKANEISPSPRYRRDIELTSTWLDRNRASA